jgi:hypothetical protein
VSPPDAGWCAHYRGNTPQRDKARAHTDERRATEVDVAVYVPNRMLDLGRPKYVRLA